MIAKKTKKTVVELRIERPVKASNNEKKSELGITVKKTDNFSEWYTQTIQKAELIEYTPVSGCMVLRPYAYSIWETVQDFFDKEIKKMGIKNAYFPLLIPESLLKKEQEHVKGFNPEVAWVTHHGNTKFEEKLAIRPTSETIMYDSYKKWIRSYRDLPLRLNQWCNVVRWEFKHPVPFLRTREFLWQEGHTAFASRKEAEKEVADIRELYARVFEELYAVPVLKGRKSETEKFAGAVYTDSVESFMPNGKAIQGGTSHLLGQNFAKAFDITFLDKNGDKQYVWQNSWGFSTRSIGVMIAVHGDDKGLVLPPRVAPVHVAIVPIMFSNKPAVNEKILKMAKKLKNELKSLKVELDDRDEYSPGFKFNYWELRGVPLRIEIGPKDLEKDQVVIVRRDTGVKEAVPINEVVVKSIKLLGDIQDNLFNNAKKFLQTSIEKVTSMNDFRKVIKSGKIAYGAWCNCKECEAQVKDETGAKTLNIPFEQPKVIGKCFCGCDKKAEKWVYFARSY
ncbi:MAG: proline--tRNA ligase [Nanoarchaeota archaeon]|nr:proline--tRNA ligase [Nanoarchaeota archaeon]MBU1321017.1 proline--tRNA ligase [Nanoarchaeota archaeon]MBU1597513.1 proline--tRNA ligase [Nanoarchaeota archaeon]MBU2441680.1 proline--tRNA ligase [Nanoarchaeota archaeon]